MNIIFLHFSFEKHLVSLPREKYKFKNVATAPPIFEDKVVQ